MAEDESFPVHLVDNDFLLPAAEDWGEGHKNKKVAIILLNSPSMTLDIVQRVWSRATVKYCADGAANRLYDCFQASGGGNSDAESVSSTCAGDMRGLRRADYIPDAIRGDLDSVSPHVRSYYEARGSRVEQDSGQDTNDLEKCVEGLLSLPLLKGGSSQDWEVLVVGPFLGRLDQELASYHASYKWVDTFSRFVLLSSSNWAEPLCMRKRHVLAINRDIEGPHCGLLVLNGPAHLVHSTGLRWNLHGETLSMGGFVSTSNVIADEGEGEGWVCECGEVNSCDQGGNSSGIGGEDGNEDDSSCEGSTCRGETLKCNVCGGARGRRGRVLLQSSGGGCLLWVCSLRLHTLNFADSTHPLVHKLA